MSFARASALRSLQSTLRHSGARAFPRARTQLVARRFASGGGHGHGEPSPDWPWALAGTVVTIPSVWYLWPETKDSHGRHHDEHHGSEEHEEKSEDKEEGEEEAPQEDSAPAEQAAESDKEDKSNEAADEKPAKDEGKKEEESKPSGKAQESDSKDEEASSSSEGKDSSSSSSDVRFKGKMHSESAGHNDSRKTEDDHKGALKKRIDSGLAQNLGAGSTSEKHAGSQEGAANTDTRHSVKIDEPGSGKSTKGEGAPETAKVKGAVDPNRPQV